MKPLVYTDTLVLPRDAGLVAQARACDALLVAHGVTGGPAPECEILPWGSSLVDRVVVGVRRLRAGHTHRLPLSTEQALIDRVGEAGVQVLHAHGGPAALRLLPAVRRLGLTLFATLRPEDLHETPDRDPAYARAIGKALRDAEHLFATTLFCQRRLIELECPRDRVELLPYGITVRPLRPRRAENRGDVRAVALGPFTESAAHADLLEAIARARRAGIALTLELAGDGPERARLEARAGEPDLAGCVRLAGPLAGAGLDALLDTCDVFLHPALPEPAADRAGPSEPLLQAMAAGLCAVTRGNEGAKVLVRDEVTGLRCEDDSLDALTDAVRRVCGDPGLRLATGAAGRVQVARDYNVQLNALRLKEYYAQAGDGGGQS